MYTGKEYELCCCSVKGSINIDLFIWLIVLFRSVRTLPIFVSLLIFLFCQIQKEFWSVRLYGFVFLDFSLPGCPSQLSDGHPKSYGFVDYQLFSLLRWEWYSLVAFSILGKVKPRVIFNSNTRVVCLSFLTCKTGKTSDLTLWGFCED